MLALFSLAAERMHSGGDLAATNYYGRLTELLGESPERSGWIGQEYRAHSLSLWNCLNLWLRRAHGQRGLPTAVPFGHTRFIMFRSHKHSCGEADVPGCLSSSSCIALIPVNRSPGPICVTC